MTKKYAFGELELSILNILKEKQKATVNDVLNSLGSNRRYTTIMTVMNRLVEKKELAREKQGRQFEYSLNTSQEKKPSSLMKRLKEKVFGGRALPMVSYLLEEGVSQEELLEIEDLIRQHKEKKCP